MSPLKRITMPMHRYGDPDFDREYLNWGLHSPHVQKAEAESLLGLIDAQEPVRILDLACGVGTHAIVWAGKGFEVTGVDLSDTFITTAKDNARQKGVNASFIVSDIRDVKYEAEFDVVTWIERSFFEANLVEVVWRSLHPEGRFIFDDRNPENPKVRARQRNWRTWREANGKFHLERHETNAETGLHEDAWITIDPQAETIEEKVGTAKAQTMQERIAILEQVGFRDVELKTMEGKTFSGGPEPSWLWVVARK